MDLDPRDRVSPALSRETAEIGVMSERVEWGIDPVAGPPRSQVGKSAGGRPCTFELEPVWAIVEAVPVARKPSERLDGDPAPAGNVTDELVEDDKRAGAPSIEDRPGDIDPDSAPVDAVEKARADELADVGNCPLVGIVDEDIFPQPIDRAPGGLGIAGDHLDQGAKDIGPKRGEVRIPVDLGNPVPQLLGIIEDRK